MNIMSCRGFPILTTRTLILPCHSALVTYYLSKVLFIVEKVEDVFVNIPEQFLNQINASTLHD